jgi:diaminobutyrate-2-oxoglutarate transaminase
MGESSLAVFERLESNVRSYGRHFPVVFSHARGAEIFDDAGRRYLDFFVGAGALNYGHNPPAIKRALLEYIEGDGITHALDKNTRPKREFLETFSRVILEPRKLDYKIQFCSPSGTDAVEAALKLVRKVTQRRGVVAFMGAYHGMSLGSLALTSNGTKRAAGGVDLHNTTFVPYPDGPAGAFDSLGLLERIAGDPSSGVALPAAIFLETLQLEGGVYAAPTEWLRRLRELCDAHKILLVCDEIQTGCGRCGSFFSFERAGIVPDLVLLSKSLSGYGLPLSVVLMRRDLDVWKPGEHTGTFRAHQLALVTARAALDVWSSGAFQEGVAERAQLLENHLRERIIAKHPHASLRGIGMARGVDLGAWPIEVAQRTQKLCFERGLVIERSGRRDEVMKVMPPITITADELSEGCDLLASAIAEATRSSSPLVQATDPGRDR